MKPIAPPGDFGVWILVSLSSNGMLTTHNPSVMIATGVFPGYFTSLDDAQQEQMLLALRGQKSHVFHLEFPMP
jgi:hypothetical protein